jgi:MoCo/4Fe-4S cofactor protein with predicted Tat translocation signal
MSTIEQLRAILPPPGAPRFWRTLDELADDPSHRAALLGTFPSLAEMEPALTRRGFLRLLGASLAFAGVTACSGPPPEHIVPEVGQGGRRSPLASRYATAMVSGMDVVGVVVELRDGRPIKVDGNPRHPMTLGGSDPRMQAAVLDLWDPARSSAPRQGAVPSSWADAEQEMARWRDRLLRASDGLHIISGPVLSPTLARQREALLARYPRATWHEHAPAGHPGGWTPVDLGNARVAVTFDADILGTLPGHLAVARAFAARRATPDDMLRLYAIEPAPTLTGRNADHAWPVAVRDMAATAWAIAAALGAADAPTGPPDDGLRQRAAIVADDLRQHAAQALVVAGPWLPPAVHRAVDAIRRQLGQPGSNRPAAPGGSDGLVQALHAGSVDSLLVLDCNPAMTLPGFADAVRHASRVVHLGRYRDETSELAHWHLPALHPFETWSDLRAADGTLSVVQPVLAPLVDGRSVHDVVDLLLGEAADEPRARVRRTWPALAEDPAWTQALREGVFTAAADAPVMRPPTAAEATARVADDDVHGPWEVVFRPDDNTWDGSGSDNAWLQELPRSTSTLTWGNAVGMSPAAAGRLGLRDGDVVRLSTPRQAVEGPVLVVPGQADSVLTLTLGHGRRKGLSRGLGYDAYRLRPADAAWHLDGVDLLPMQRNEPLALVQAHQDMQRRDIVRAGTPAHPPVYPQTPPPPTLYPDRNGNGHRWGMAIDLNACIGCNACTVACQSENNIPVVGKEEVMRGRRMHWIRVDRYHEGDPAAPRSYHQPVPCMHCEHAPCEVVCPVEATVHDSEGLNLQVYNRCIGTRFCSNNCPYKVRRFNFLRYADFASESLKAMRNPEVSVRDRGVMEKCTYCVQRIQAAHIAADRDGRDIARDAVTTACQDACPTRAITFGDLADAGSAVSQQQASERRYLLLEELNTRPRTAYLAALRNPNPRWVDA